MKRLALLSALATSANAAFSFPKTYLALLGPVYQAQLNPSANAFVNAEAQARKAVQQAVSTGNTSYGVLDTTDTSFSASVFILTEETIYRTGSMAKLLTMYIWMVDIGDDVFNDPITKYIPELAHAANSSTYTPFSVNWREVIIGALATVLHCIFKFHTVHTGDLALTTFTLPPVAEDVLLGYPPLNETVPQCNFYGPQKTCSRKQLLDGVIQHPPVYPSYITPVYSNLAIAILALAYEEITGIPFDAGFSRIFNEKLGLSSTYRYPPPGADAIIPHNDSFSLFSSDLGLEAPAGGEYTSTKDLRVIGQSILSSALLPSYITRRWMKPRKVQANTIINAGRDVGKYSTFIGLVPDYNIGMTILAAWNAPDSSVYAIRDTIVDIFYPAAETATKEKSEKAFTGTFAANDRNSSITLAIEGGLGVAITSLVSNGTDFLTGILAAYSDFRLYPTEQHTSRGRDGLTFYLYHLNSLQQNGEPFTQDFSAVFNNEWLMVDSLNYINLATDTFTIGFDKQGVVQSVRCQALRSTMYRSADWI
ncbi:beta-lactamase/transpeptidase-like protein [Talaromyces proteolyticus]|uniref:Beta-lactamase/transpeptidase-like protein n=1 Tax=Talaromyces proteolyticus TaxID=1131652 RepID=A0AAD4KJG8_9EURO|nr:beta-lactamase/transpeptidase-like protein [Talaromyces proteolyticus]KAH8691668.1 beta-lactamase/transpeptidase-like protein [Talaromyces proteolyticus]